MFMQKLLLCLVFLQANLAGLCQLFEAVDYPKGYFRNPLALPINLSGNFGEMRPNHYHMGLDLKTNARENQPVYAAAEGYISRIKIEPAGFGRAIYINHPNGFTTLYAHLNNFNPALEAWVKKQQYEQEQWNVYLELSPDQFPVKKGDFLAYSGNTGGSQAPHLHWEIRRTRDDVNLNPMLFGLPLTDNTRPRVLRMAFYNRDQSVYEQSPRIVPVKAAGANYVSSLPLITLNSPRVSMAITAYDTHTGSNNPNGVFEALLYVDDQLQTGFRMDQISYNSTRYLNAHIDYKYRSTGGAYLQHLSELPGYTNSIYKAAAGNGIIDLSDRAIHTVKIVVRDAYQNSTTVTAKLKWSGSYTKPATPPGKLFYPLMLDGYESEEAEFFIGESCLYDSAHIRYTKQPATHPNAVSALHQIGSPQIPLQDAFLIRLMPDRVLTEAQKSRTVMYRTSGGRTEVQKVEWQQNWAAARFRDFGAFELLVDTTPPKIVPLGFSNGANLSKASRILFTVTDNLSRFKKVRAELDGNWLRFTNDKGRTFSYQFDEKCLSGKHELRITAEDEAGNTAESIFHFTR